MLNIATLAALAWTGCQDLGRSFTHSLDETPTAASADPPHDGGQHSTRGESQFPAIRNGIGMQLVRIAAGSFSMGDPFWNRYGRFGLPERHVHDVRITRPFYIGKCEVTVGQFREFVDATGYQTEAERDGTGCNHLDLDTGAVFKRPASIWSAPGFAQTDDHPVVCVSWRDAVAFCEWLSEREGHRYRLPTEAEWEYCCRAGTQTTFSCGDDPFSLQECANLADHSLKSRFPGLTWQAPWDDGFRFTAPVGQRAPNAWGLCDMHGNVGEWCGDWFDTDYYANSETNDPQGPRGPREFRVVRGGSWYNNANGCRSAGRHDGIPTARSTTNGFRVVLEIDSIDSDTATASPTRERPLRQG